MFEIVTNVSDVNFETGEPRDSRYRECKDILGPGCMLGVR